MKVSISVDLDEIYCYYQIYGLNCNKKEFQLYPVYYIALERLQQFFEAEGINEITLFVIGKDLEHQTNAQKIKALKSLGYEIANHTYSHPYNLIKLSDEEIVNQIEDASTIIYEVTGERPVGFRAPGYNITEKIYTILKERFFLYDSSIFPSPPYYILKGLVIFFKKIQGKKSASLLGSSRNLLHKSNIPFKKYGIIELPVGVTPYLRIPLIGTFFSLLGERISNILIRATQLSCEYLCIEFHGIDFLEEKDLRQFPEIIKEQKDLKIPWNKKRDIFKKVISYLKDNGSSFFTMYKLAEEASKIIT